MKDAVFIVKSSRNVPHACTEELAGLGDRVFFAAGKNEFRAAIRVFVKSHFPISCFIVLSQIFSRSREFNLVEPDDAPHAEQRPQRKSYESRWLIRSFHDPWPRNHVLPAVEMRFARLVIYEKCHMRGRIHRRIWITGSNPAFCQSLRFEEKLCHALIDDEICATQNAAREIPQRLRQHFHRRSRREFPCPAFECFAFTRDGFHDWRAPRCWHPRGIRLIRKPDFAIRLAHKGGKRQKKIRLASRFTMPIGSQFSWPKKS